MPDIILSVSQVNFYIKSLFEQDENLSGVYITGEVSNFTHHRSGHLYMSLKDENAQIKAVMFRQSAMRLRFMPENGMKVVARGRVSVFERDGQYQLYIEDMLPDGVGALHVAYEQLKAKLQKEGLFSPEHKKPIPRCPMRVGVITSPTGAAVQDILNVLARRFPLAKVVFCPVQVQGGEAPSQIIDAISRFGASRAADVIILGRGGGSIEDLWAFNDEGVARAVFNCPIPIISAVGHETDFTICDFVADLRAPTPSAAAELAVPDAFDQKGVIAAFRYALINNMTNMIGAQRQSLRGLAQSRAMRVPRRVIDENRLLLDSLYKRVCAGFCLAVSAHRERLSFACGKLQSLSPLRVLVRGYSIAYKSGNVVNSVKNLSAGDRLLLQLSDGSVDVFVKEIV